MEIENRIIETVEKLFLKFGIRSITMDEIAKDLGISKKTIYTHFSDKDDLVEKVSEYILQKERIKCEDAYKNANNAIEEIMLSTNMMREMLENINPILFFDLEKYYPAAWNQYQGFKAEIFEIIKRNLKEGIEQGLYRKEINIDILAKLRTETVDLAFNSDVFPPLKYNILDVQMESLNNFLRGIITQKGLELLNN